ncbi:MAG: hemin uptake protein HemP [Pseudomonadota bacterium]
MTNDATPISEPPEEVELTAEQRRPRYAAEELVGGGDVAEIVLDDEIYVLRVTRQRKLLLTK